jgi:hypothetical protein
MVASYLACLETTSASVAAAERCTVACGTSGDAEREPCALFAMRGCRPARGGADAAAQPVRCERVPALCHRLR